MEGSEILNKSLEVRAELDVLRCLCIVFSKLRVVGGWMVVWARHNNNNHYAQLKKLNCEEKIGFLERTMQFSGS